MRDHRWESTYNAYRGKCMTFARNASRQLPRMGVDDIYQEMLEVLWKTMQSYDPNRGARFNTIFQQNAVNRVISLIRHNNTKGRTGVAISLDVEAVAIAVDAFVETASSEDTYMLRIELREAVLEYGVDAVMGKPKRQRRVA